MSEIPNLNCHTGAQLARYYQFKLWRRSLCASRTDPTPLFESPG